MFRSTLITASVVGVMMFSGLAFGQDKKLGPAGTDLLRKASDAPQNLLPIGPVAFKGNTEIVLVTSSRSPSEKTNKKVLEKINIKNILDLVWNGHRSEAESSMRKFLADPKHTGGRHLENIRVAMAKAGPRSRMTLKVDPSHKHFDVTYTVPANEIDFSVDVSFLPDPSFRVNFDIVVTASFQTNGTGAHAPLALTKATVRTANVKVRGDTIADVEDFLAQLLTGSNPAIRLERAVSRTNIDITKNLTSTIDRIDDVIRRAAPHTQMTPSFERSTGTLVLTLTPTSIAPPKTAKK